MLRLGLSALVAMVITGVLLETLGLEHDFWLYVFAVAVAWIGHLIILWPDRRSWGFAAAAAAVGAAGLYWLNQGFVWIIIFGLMLMLANLTKWLADRR